MARNQPHSLAVGGLAALAVAVGIGRFVFTPILPGMMADLGLSGGQAGLIASANYAGYLLGALAAALPMPASRRLMLALSLVVSCLTTLAMAGLSTLWAITAMRFVGGLASAGGFVFACGMVLERSAARGDAAAPKILFAGVGVGITISALLVAIIQGVGLDWRVDWLLSGLVSILLAGLAIAKMDDDAAVKHAVRSAQCYTGGTIPLVLAYGLFGMGYIVTATFLVAIIRAQPSLQAVEPFAWLIVGVTAAFSVAIWLNVAARWGTLVAFAAACLLEAVGVGVSVGLATEAGMVIAAALLGGTFMGVVTLGLVAARERAAGDPQRLLALMTAAFGIGQIVGPVLAGFLHDRTGDFTLASYSAAVVLILAALLALVTAAWSTKTLPV